MEGAGIGVSIILAGFDKTILMMGKNRARPGAWSIQITSISADR